MFHFFTSSFSVTSVQGSDRQDKRKFVHSMCKKRERARARTRPREREKTTISTRKQNKGNNVYINFCKLTREKKVNKNTAALTLNENTH